MGRSKEAVEKACCPDVHGQEAEYENMSGGFLRGTSHTLIYVKTFLAG